MQTSSRTSATVSWEGKQAWKRIDCSVVHVWPCASAISTPVAQRSRRVHDGKSWRLPVAKGARSCPHGLGGVGCEGGRCRATSCHGCFSTDRRSVLQLVRGAGERRRRLDAPTPAAATSGSAASCTALPGIGDAGLPATQSLRRRRRSRARIHPLPPPSHQRLHGRERRVGVRAHQRRGECQPSGAAAGALLLQAAGCRVPGGVDRGGGALPGQDDSHHQGLHGSRLRFPAIAGRRGTQGCGVPAGPGPHRGQLCSEHDGRAQCLAHDVLPRGAPLPGRGLVRQTGRIKVLPLVPVQDGLGCGGAVGAGHAAAGAHQAAGGEGEGHPGGDRQAQGGPPAGQERAPEEPFRDQAREGGAEVQEGGEAAQGHAGEAEPTQGGSGDPRGRHQPHGAGHLGGVDRGDVRASRAAEHAEGRRRAAGQGDDVEDCRMSLSAPRPEGHGPAQQPRHQLALRVCRAVGFELFDASRIDRLLHRLVRCGTATGVPGCPERQGIDGGAEREIQALGAGHGHGRQKRRAPQARQGRHHLVQ